MMRRRKKRLEPAAQQPVAEQTEQQTAEIQPAAAEQPAAQEPAAEQAVRQQKKPLWRRILRTAMIALACAAAVCCIGAVLYYLPVRPLLTVELGEPLPEAGAFMRKGEATYADPVEGRYAVGFYVLKVNDGKRTRPVVLRVRDSIPPAAEGVETTVSTMQSPTPEKLVRNITDQSVVKLTFERAPKYGTVGDYTAIVRLEDKSGNDTRVPVKVHVRVTRDEVVCEAGDPVPDASAFLIDEYTVSDCTEITEEMMHTPGAYPITLTADGMTANSRLIVRDTVPPQADIKPQIAEPDDEPEPEDFISNVVDETEVSMRFLVEPDPDLRSVQTVRIELCDLGGNCTELETELLFTSVQPVAVEASDGELQPEDFLEEGTYVSAAFLESFIPNRPGTHMVRMEIDGEENIAIIEVRDTVAPKLRMKKTKWFLNAPRDASFFAATEDATATKLRFAEEPDWKKESQEVTLIATDAAGNESQETFTLVLKEDKKPPELIGVRNQTGYVNEPVSFLSDVSAEDECDGEVEVTVDTSKVDITKTGTYTVTYSATDRAGNTVKKKAQLKIVESRVSEEEAEAVAQQIMKKILHDGMTLDEQVEAMYDYVFKNVHYVGRSNKQDWRSEAVRGLTTNKGDCFTAYACMRLLLEHTDAQFMSVQRLSKRTHHYWMIVNLGSGWYHVDACNTGKGRKRCFMWTNAQKDKVSKSFWRFDESLYPPIATEPYKKGN